MGPVFFVLESCGFCVFFKCHGISQEEGLHVVVRQNQPFKIRQQNFSGKSCGLNVLSHIQIPVLQLQNYQVTRLGKHVPRKLLFTRFFCCALLNSESYYIFETFEIFQILFYSKVMAIGRPYLWHTCCLHNHLYDNNPKSQPHS